MLDLIDSRQVAALVVNPQTETAATAQIEAAAPAGIGSRRQP